MTLHFYKENLEQQGAVEALGEMINSNQYIYIYTTINMDLVFNVTL